MKKKPLANPSTWERATEQRHYIVTIGLTRRLVEAANEDAARVKTIGLLMNPDGVIRSARRVVVTEDEVLAHEATPAEVAEFTKARKQHLVPGEAERLFDVNTVPIDPRKG